MRRFCLVLPCLLILVIGALGIHYANARGGLVTISTAAGSVTVSPEFAPKIKGFIADAVARGFKGRVHCFAHGGHTRNSRHYSGNACDFAQRGWGKTTAPMYHVADLAKKHGLRDGCTFRDCGHIDDGGHVGHRHYRHQDEGTMIASRHRREVKVAARHHRRGRVLVASAESSWAPQMQAQAFWAAQTKEAQPRRLRLRHHQQYATVQPQAAFKSYAPL